MTHKQLVERAARWLRYSCRLRDGLQKDGGARYHTFRCGVVLTELATYESERPDAIGWAAEGTLSVLIECKANWRDFVDDQNKRHRRKTQLGMGQYRFYMAPDGVLRPAELPPDWGLLVAKGRRVIIERDASPRYWNHGAEKTLLWSYCRRTQVANRKQESRQGVE